MYTYTAKLSRVIDGDTIRLDLDLGFGMWRRDQSYRLGRIDAPEMSTEAGTVAKVALDGMLGAAASLLVTTSRADKYGRWLVEVFADGQNINDLMVATGYAVYRTY